MCNSFAESKLLKPATWSLAFISITEYNKNKEWMRDKREWKEDERTDHEPANNMEACNEIDAVLGVLICKNLFLCSRQKTDYYLLMMPGDKTRTYWRGSIRDAIHVYAHPA